MMMINSSEIELLWPWAHGPSASNYDMVIGCVYLFQMD